MHTWRITFRPEPGWRRLVIDVEADELDVEARDVHLVLWRSQMVVGHPQRVIVRRLHRDEATVERMCSGVAQDDPTQPFSPNSRIRR